jgi:hypothetical protein
MPEITDAKNPPVAAHVESSAPARAGNTALGSALCTNCGLCCTGALHNEAVLEPDEVEYARSIGMTLRTEGRPGFALPCPQLSGSCCSIYAGRPKVCRRFRCGLLEQLDEGSIDIEAASAIVAEARQLFDVVRAQLPERMTIPVARQKNVALPTPGLDADGRASEMRLQLAITALSLFLDRHFRRRGEGKLLKLDTIGDIPPDTEMK